MISYRILIITFLFAFVPFIVFSQDKCTIQKTFYRYYKIDGSLGPTFEYHTEIFCNFPFDNDPDVLLNMKYDTTSVYEDKYLTVLDVAESSEQQIVYHLFTRVEFLRLQNRRYTPPYFRISWEDFFKNFGLLEGRTITGMHPRNGFARVFISFDSITRHDTIFEIRNIFDINGQYCGEILLTEDGKEVIRLLYDNTGQERSQQLQLTYLPRFMVD